MIKTIVLVMFACIRPWVKNKMITGSTNSLRFIKLADRIGCEVFFSTRNNPTRLISDSRRTIRKLVEVQPKFCPKDGTHRSRLKKMITRIAPGISKLVIV